MVPIAELLLKKPLLRDSGPVAVSVLVVWKRTALPFTLLMRRPFKVRVGGKVTKLAPLPVKSTVPLLGLKVPPVMFTLLTNVNVAFGALKVPPDRLKILLKLIIPAPGVKVAPV